MVIWKQFIKHSKKMMNCQPIKDKKIYELDDKKPKQNKDKKI